ncbi:hypothetical protein Ais01nite_12290 [Asanoa ishikariensis]|uniref:Uncharacterized protein n=1 Tax=Asanoa ishikariensis TaxID=137265 RepID=A0A1H3T2G7_9ACTN|nr:hypothetical protein [Asanoa ishikariensis]GIF63194.1 hypothetical protein Ais01nite_12290 [Asanoa ishikariensis]SDZ43539.1 hypothetical protein SAMN05421684_4998 [Asanoa ishikariensis]
MTAMRLLRAAGLALSVAAGLTLLASPALAEPGDAAAPTEVGAWFAQDAPRVAGDVLGRPAANLAIEAGPGAIQPGKPVNGYRAGTPVRLHTWNDAFVEGGAGQPVVASDEWVAPLYQSGVVVGTIAAAVSATGQVSMTYVDDDAVGGRALASGMVSGQVVQDARVGGLVDVRSDGSAQGLSKVAAGKLPAIRGKGDLHKAVAAAHAPGNWLPTGTETGAGPAPEPTDTQPLALVLMVVLSGMVLWFVLRRRQQPA